VKAEFWWTFKIFAINSRMEEFIVVIKAIFYMVYAFSEFTKLHNANKPSFSHFLS
jgi:hypothetical protein